MVKVPAQTDFRQWRWVEWVIIIVFTGGVGVMGLGAAIGNSSLVALGGPFAALALAVGGGAKGKWVWLSGVALVVSLAATLIGWPSTEWLNRVAGLSSLLSLLFDVFALRGSLKIRKLSTVRVAGNITGDNASSNQVAGYFFVEVTRTDWKTTEFEGTINGVVIHAFDGLATMKMTTILTGTGEGDGLSGTIYVPISPLPPTPRLRGTASGLRG
jgi:hypothetical protein